LFALLLALALVMASAVACSRGEGAEDESGSDSADASSSSDDSDDEDSDDEDAEEAVPIEAVELSRGRIEAVLNFSTNLEAENDVQVFSEAARKVRQLLVEEGSEVRRGQVLIRLQDDEQRTALARAESQLKKAQREYERQTRLYEQQLISEETYTDATYNLEQLGLALEDAKRQLGYTEVKAPISGTVTARLVNVGDHVTMNQHLFDIVDFDSIVARIYVPEKELYRLSDDLEARIFAEAAGSEARRGTVDRVAPRVDPRSGTVKVTVAIPRNQELLPGMYVTVELITNVHEDALLVPKKALVYDADQIFIFRPLPTTGEAGEEQLRVERLLIHPVLEDRDYIEPAGSLEAGDRVVVAGQAGLKDGSLVRYVGEAEAETEEPAEAGR
jgi:membrane fusion protein (multidrug efflux system)